MGDDTPVKAAAEGCLGDVPNAPLPPCWRCAGIGGETSPPADDPKIPAEVRQAEMLKQEVVPYLHNFIKTICLLSAGVEKLTNLPFTVDT